MSQITWRNVNSDMTAYQGRALEGAGRNFDSMFDKLSGAMARTQAIDEKNWDNTKVNRTNDALNQIMGYGSPEAMAQAQQAGALQAMLQGGQIDQQAVRTAFDSRLPELQKRATQGFAYDNAVVDQRTAPLMEAARMQALNGDFEGAKATLIKGQAMGARNGSQVAEFSDGRQRLNTTRGYEDQKQVWAGSDQVIQERAAADALLSSAMQRQQMQNNMSNDNARTALDRERFGLDRARAEREGDPNSRGNLEKQFAERVKTGPLSQGFYGTAEGTAILNKELTALGFNSDQKTDLFANLSEYYKNGVAVAHKNGKPVRAPLPISTILEAAASVNEGNPLSPLIPGWSRRGDRTVNEIDKRFGVDSRGNIDAATSKGKDLDLIDEIGWYANAQAQRTKGLDRVGVDLEIKNPPPKGKGKKPTR